MVGENIFTSLSERQNDWMDTKPFMANEIIF